MTENLLVMDIILKDNKGQLFDCVVFKVDDVGVESIQDINELELLLEKGNDMLKSNMFFIQNRFIHSRIYISQIESYTIHEISGKDY